jgi:threonine dehydrogenase-like Zn-dependent dehydrogenase
MAEPCLILALAKLEAWCILMRDFNRGGWGMKTEGLWYLGERKIELRSMEIPGPGPDEVAVALEVCGICGWDILSFNGKFARYHAYPFCAGHEGVGRVIKVGEKVRSVKTGQRVAMHELPIGTPGGALMARHALRSERQVAAIPEGPLAVHFWIVEPAVCVVNGIVFAGIQPGDDVAVVGAGYMGLLFVQGLNRSLTGSITAFDVDTRRLELAARFGARQTVDLKSAKLPEAMKKRFDVVIETAATADSMNVATSIVKAGGIIENFAWHHHTHTFDLEDWHINGWRILNIQPGMNPHFGDLYPRTITLMANGTLSNEQLVTHVEKVERAHDIFTAAADKTGGYIKGVVTF